MNVVPLSTRYNQLSTIPHTLANCTSLEEFNIEGNHVTELPVCKSCNKRIGNNNSRSDEKMFSYFLIW